jgi:hypothetical protein
MKMQVALVALVLAFSQLAPMKASAFTPDVEILSLKGYSPETIETTMVARSRAEWRGTAPTKRSPVQRFLYNVIHGNLTDSIDETGYSIIRRN